jgi:cytoskeletal protein CcmA (bactofilin family)
MKFFDPKKKDSVVPENPVSMPRPVNPQHSSAPVPNLNPKPAPPVGAGPVSEPIKQAEPSKPEPVKVEPVKQEPLKMEVSKPQPAAPTISMPAPETAKPAVTMTKPVGKTLIGNSVVIRGDVTSSENLQIEGVVDGSVETSNDVVVGSEGRVNASIRAGNITIQGRVVGDVIATNRVELSPGAMLQGNIRAPKLSIAEKALFKGSIDMRPRESASSREVKDQKEKATTAAPLETVEK